MRGSSKVQEERVVLPFLNEVGGKPLWRWVVVFLALVALFPLTYSVAEVLLEAVNEGDRSAVYDQRVKSATTADGGTCGATCRSALAVTENECKRDPFLVALLVANFFLALDALAFVGASGRAGVGTLLVRAVLFMAFAGFGLYFARTNPAQWKYNSTVMYVVSACALLALGMFVALGLWAVKSAIG